MKTKSHNQPKRGLGFDRPIQLALSPDNFSYVVGIDVANKTLSTTVARVHNETHLVEIIHCAKFNPNQQEEFEAMIKEAVGRNSYKFVHETN